LARNVFLMISCLGALVIVDWVARTYIVEFWGNAPITQIVVGRLELARREGKPVGARITLFADRCVSCGAQSAGAPRTLRPELPLLYTTLPLV
jgi:hypothetical protein